MSIIARMLSRMILVRFLGILFGISVFILSLEVISYSKEILALDRGDMPVIVQYLLMRLPATLATFIPMSFLLALLLTLAELSYRSEVTAIWAGGISPARLIWMLMPLCLLVGAMHFLISDRAIPGVAPTLRSWGIGDYGEKRLKLGERDPIWMRSGQDVLRVAKANPQSTILEDVYIFRRDANGILQSQVWAEKATLQDGVWTLKDAIVVSGTQAKPQRVPVLTYAGNVKPAQAGLRTGDPEEMTIGDLGHFIANQGFGLRSTFVYQTWWHKRLTPWVTALLMAAICIPLASRFRRGGGLGILFSAGVALGFLYFIMDGMLVSAGELGFVTPWLAAWLPTMMFGGLALALILRSERA
jgi:lipopolysaccharide export system permease protein